MKIQPLNRRVIIQKPEKKKHAGALILPDEKEENPIFQVKKVFPDVNDVKEGDFVICNRFTPKTFFIDNEEIFIVHIDDIIAIYDDLDIEEQNGIL